MNVIFVGKFMGKPLRCQLDGKRQLLASTVIISLFVGLLVAGGYWYGKTHAVVNELIALEYDISKQKELIHETRQSATTEFDILAMRLGKMQANVIRLNALGQRLVKVAKLDAEEFDFQNAPSYGGPAEAESVVGIHFSSINLDGVISSLNQQLTSREAQLDVIEEVIMNRQLKSDSIPRGRPIKSGWLSSNYGMRADPFTGKLAMHKGKDFAAKEGSAVIAVANGVVTWSGTRSGFGNLVEINHGNGYVTRYGHNAELLVEAGDRVVKGQSIATIGSTGRSTGPHVHFEVLKNGQQVNPSKYIALK